MRVNMTLTSVISTRCVILTSTNLIQTRTNVISIRTRLISTRKLRFPHAECDFTRRVWFALTRMCVNMTLTSVITTRTTVIHPECNFHTHSDFDTYECNNVTHDCDFNTHKSDVYTQSVTSKRMSVIMTLTSGRLKNYHMHACRINIQHTILRVN
jgi:hypothetical protein